MGIDELTKDVDCDSLFESSYLDGVNPKSPGPKAAPRLTDLPEETLHKWTYNGAIPKVLFHIDNQSCPWRDKDQVKTGAFAIFKHGMEICGNMVKRNIYGVKN